MTYFTFSVHCRGVRIAGDLTADKAIAEIVRLRSIGTAPDDINLGWTGWVKLGQSGVAGVRARLAEDVNGPTLAALVERIIAEGYETNNVPPYPQHRVYPLGTRRW